MLPRGRPWRASGGGSRRAGGVDGQVSAPLCPRQSSLTSCSGPLLSLLSLSLSLSVGVVGVVVVVAVVVVVCVCVCVCVRVHMRARCALLGLSIFSTCASGSVV